MSEIPALSPHVAHVLETESPLHAWTYHRLLGGMPKPPTDPQTSGTILHNLLLEGGDKIVPLPHADYRKEVAKADRELALANGLLPCLQHKLDEAMVCVERWKERLQELQINGRGFSFDDGDTEVPLEWEEQGVLCHGRPDWLSPSRALIVDWKTTEGSAAPDVCAAKLLRTAGVIQDWAYRSAVELENPELAGRVEVIFLFAQTVEPYAVTPIICGPTMREIGCGRWRRALETWARCLKTNEWPSYTRVPIHVEAPGWMLAQEMMNEERIG
jgi:hypothetical protein